ncbi:MAG: imidazole glycerol phosphate synthase subunit HisH [Eubacteriaceae bacterium]|jgi:glutamine amidotransferase|nr:imidazole glycerol phosphate synthase subunit HisH [Eubacteriaceae bacterium]
MIGIVDYGVGNLRNVQKAVERLGGEAQISSSANVLHSSDAIILPGVGAFGDAAGKLASSGLKEFVDEWVESGKLLLGICVGMQLLFDVSYEFGECKGLGYLQGAVVPFPAGALKVPHIGWNQLEGVADSPLLEGVHNGDYVYFVHSFYAEPIEEDLLAYTEYGVKAAACVGKGNVYGTQFHPEKSAGVGSKILSNFLEMAK